jgi:hypothetical protein
MQKYVCVIFEGTSRWFVLDFQRSVWLREALGHLGSVCEIKMLRKCGSQGERDRPILVRSSVVFHSLAFRNNQEHMMNSRMHQSVCDHLERSGYS